MLLCQKSSMIQLAEIVLADQDAEIVDADKGLVITLTSQKYAEKQRSRVAVKSDASSGGNTETTPSKKSDEVALVDSSTLDDSSVIFETDGGSAKVIETLKA